MSNEISVLPKDRIIIRTPAVWYMVTLEFVQTQMKFSKNPVFKRAFDMAKRKKENGN